MERLAEMQNLGSAFAAAGGHVLAHFPIHRGLERVLDRERAAFDQEHALERRHPDHAPVGVEKTGVAFRINVGICDLDLGRAQEIGLYLRLVEMRMIEPDRVGAEKAVEIDQLPIVRRVVKIRTFALVEIDHDPKTVEQDMLGDLPEHGRFRFGIGFLARTDATARRSAGRLGEHGWHTHPLRVVGGEILVNRTAG